MSVAIREYDEGLVEKFRDEKARLSEVLGAEVEIAREAGYDRRKYKKMKNGYVEEMLREVREWIASRTQ